MKKKAIIYTRVSTDEQRESGFSLQEQEARLRKYCVKQNVDAVAHYQDDHSAKNFNRPAFQNMLADLRSGRIKADIFLCVRMDRFSRDAYESIMMIKTLAKYGLDFRVIEGHYDLDVPENWIPFMLDTVLPQVERVLSAKSVNFKCN